MGLSNSWIAVRGLSQAEAIAELGLETGDEIRHDVLPDFGIGQTSDGWTILVFRRERAFEDRFTALSKGRSAVACFEEEHVMYSEARGYADGAETWRAVHDCEKGLRHIQTSGAVPGAFAEIEARLAKQQDEDDGADFFFDIPPELAKSVCGFRLLGEPEITFVDLIDPNAPRKRPRLLARLFGAR